MTAAQNPADVPDGLQALLALQRAAHLAQPHPAAALRIDRLDRAIQLLVTHQRRLCAALADDFGQRPQELSAFMDVFPAVHALKFARRHLRAWMRPQRLRLGLPVGVPGTRGILQAQPLGVIGVVTPWNFPIALSFGPLAGIVAAGNRCLLKPSEFTPGVSSLLHELVAQSFDPSELAVVTGGPDVAQTFVGLPFDHLLFTGSTTIGRLVMQAAARNLVPVTLELGGKCPVVIGRSAPLARAVDRIMMAKLANAGQICLAPDHVWLPREAVDEFVTLARSWTQRAYPGLPGNTQYTSLIDERHVDRIAALLADARSQGATLISLAPDLPDTPRPAGPRLVSPTLIVGAAASMRVMQEEIFGPVLPLVTYDRIEDALARINSGERPLALYYFGEDRAEETAVLAGTCCGGVTINDIAMHFMAEELPFGGVGASGMGAYHGEHGFRRFSHERPIFRQGRLDLAGLVGLRPPYTQRLRRALNLLIRH